MLPKNLLKKLRDYEIRIRKAINSQMHGDFHSVFKGTGLEFEDVRQYQYGDDVRTIDWNTSAKGHGAFVKTFREEKEQTIFFILDVSASQEVGPAGQRKIDIGREICGVLTLSAIKEGSHVGMMGFSDVKENYVKPGRGMRHAFKILNSMFALEPRSRQTDIDAAVKFAMGMLRRKSVIIFISDFIDEDYEKNLKALAHRHDLVVIHLIGHQERNLPGLGIIPLHDNESGKTVWVNSSSPRFREQVNKVLSGSAETLGQVCRSAGANYLSVDTSQDFVEPLVELFKVRNRRGKRRG